MLAMTNTESYTSVTPLYYRRELLKIHPSWEAQQNFPEQAQLGYGGD